MCLAIPGKILEIEEKGELERTGKVSFGGVVKEVNLAFTPDAKIGDWCLVHTGMAINTLSEEEALETLKYFEEMDEILNETGK